MTSGFSGKQSMKQKVLEPVLGICQLATVAQAVKYGRIRVTGSGHAYIRETPRGGGDTGHGGRTYFRSSDEGSTDIHVTPFTDRFGGNGVEVTLGGDCERETMIRALKFITKVLEEESEEVYD